MLRFARGLLPQFQFRLRSLVLGMSIIAVALAPVRAEIARCQAIQGIVEHVSRCRGEVFFDYQWIEEGVVLRQLKNNQPGWIRKCLGAYAFAHIIEIRLDRQIVDLSTLKQIAANCPKLRHLSLRGASVNDTMMEQVALCRQLEFLELSDTNISEKALTQLAYQDRLETLCLENTKVSGSSFVTISKLDKLRNVTLENADIDDHDVAQLADSKSIETLFLAGTEITDASIPHLARMPNLATISLNRTRITASGKAQLQKLRPEISQT
jgi:hypothetical protein